MTVEPLTHRNAEGVVYQRTTLVERQIREALKLPPDRLAERVTVLDEQSSDFLKEEALVYLLRHYHLAGERCLVNRLAEALLHRCANLLNSHLRSLDTEAQQNGYDATVAALFDQVLLHSPEVLTQARQVGAGRCGQLDTQTRSETRPVTHPTTSSYGSTLLANAIRGVITSN